MLYIMCGSYQCDNIQVTDVIMCGSYQCDNIQVTDVIHHVLELSM